MYLPILSEIIGGVSDYFVTRQEIKKVKVQAEKEVIIAEAKARIAQMEKESKQDYDINMTFVKNMEKSIKDEIVLLLICIPMVMLFIPSMQEIAMGGFEALDDTPLWYQILLLGVFFSIYGLRDIFKIVLQFLIGKSKA